MPSYIAMKTLKTSSALLLIAVASLVANESEPSTFARFVPERLDDFAWENDLIAFRAYGPAARSRKEDAGIDCWLKRVEYPIVNKWYDLATRKEGKKSYHNDHGEGLDNYHVGSSAGCGGTGLWIDGKREGLEAYTSWEILEASTKQTVFVLTYEHEINGVAYKEAKQITISLGTHVFKAESTFWKDGELAVGLPVVVGVTTHDGKAKPLHAEDAHWVGAWEVLDGFGLGTGVIVDPAYTVTPEIIDSKKKDQSHALLLTQTDANGRIVYYAGYAWEAAEYITTEDGWIGYLSSFAHSLQK